MGVETTTHMRDTELNVTLLEFMNKLRLFFLPGGFCLHIVLICLLFFLPRHTETERNEDTHTHAYSEGTMGHTHTHTHTHTKIRMHTHTDTHTLAFRLLA